MQLTNFSNMVCVFIFVLNKRPFSLQAVYLILYKSECCQPLHCQELQNHSTITAVMVILVVVIYLIINQSCKQCSKKKTKKKTVPFETFLIHLLYFPFFKGGAPR